ncbi:ATP-binding protein [Irregularibacter muris]|uniref:ATP-binding protein n=1 Tax=Irregularibacter muris TaxID=1796619 RepID=A0AAE3HES4_9FIRM|nr:ATP-binding protein [Irregularibacter muris]MCR1897808.1 ATP-binding protein [Irregularibacter muris]
MDSINNLIERVNILKSSSENSEPSKFECNRCKDTGFTMIEEKIVGFCECRKLKEANNMLEKSGIAKSFRDRTFENFKPINKVFLNAKKTAIEYIQNFERIAGERNHSIAFLGQVGAGKTHLSIAIGNQLIESGIPVIYMEYRNAITALKQNMLDDVYYRGQISKYQNAKVLIIDDLFKGRITESDLNIMFEIINHRYFNGFPIVISSEKTELDLLDIDEAIGSRILEMCKGRMIIFEGPELNYRLRG